MNKFMKILQSIGIAIIFTLIISGFIGLFIAITMPFVVILLTGIFILFDIIGEWIICGIIIGLIIIHFAREIYKNVL